MKKPEIIALGCIVLLVGIAFAVMLWPRSPKSSTSVHTPSVVTKLEPFVIPREFPWAIPIESNVQIKNNYNAVSAQGRIQATRSFQSRKNVEENAAFYKEFLTDPKNRWTFLDLVVVDPAHQALFAQNATGSLSINIAQSPQNPKTAIVEITFVQKSKP